MRRLLLGVILLVSPVIAQTTVDVVVIATGTANALVTPTILDTSTQGAAKGTWAYGSGRQAGVPIDPLTAFNHTFLIADTFTRRTTLIANSVSYDTGNRAISWDMGAAPTSTDWETAEWTPPTTITGSFSASFVVVFNTDPSTDPLVSIDMLSIYYGGIFAVAQFQAGNVLGGGTAGVVHAHGGTSGGSLNGTDIPVDLATPYVITLRANVPNQRSEVVITNGTTGAVIGSSRGGFEPGGDPVSFVIIGDYLVNGAGYYTQKFIAFDWTNAVIPQEPITVPAPTILNLTQTAAGTARILFSGKGLSYKIDRRISGGSWGPLETAYYTRAVAIEYLDPTVSNGVSYEYRVTATIGTTDSVVVSTGDILINNSPSGTESTYATQASSSASVSVTEGHTLSQRIKNTLGTSLWVSEITLNTEFFDRGEPEYLWLTQNSDGTGTIYGVSNQTNISGNGPITFEFFTPAAVPTTGCYAYYAPGYTRTQFLHSASDVYFPGEGYNASYDNSGTILGTTCDLVFTVKQQPPVTTNITTTRLNVTTLRITP